MYQLCVTASGFWQLGITWHAVHSLTNSDIKSLSKTTHELHEFIHVFPPKQCVRLPESLVSPVSPIVFALVSLLRPCLTCFLLSPSFPCPFLFPFLGGVAAFPWVSVLVSSCETTFPVLDGVSPFRDLVSSCLLLSAIVLSQLVSLSPNLSLFMFPFVGGGLILHVSPNSVLLAILSVSHVFDTVPRNTSGIHPLFGICGAVILLQCL